MAELTYGSSSYTDEFFIFSYFWLNVCQELLISLLLLAAATGVCSICRASIPVHIASSWLPEIVAISVFGKLCELEPSSIMRCELCTEWLPLALFRYTELTLLDDLCYNAFRSGIGDLSSCVESCR